MGINEILESLQNQHNLGHINGTEKKETESEVPRRGLKTSEWCQGQKDF